MKRFMWGLLFWVFAGSALADSTTSSIDSTDLSTFKNASDISINYLGQIFGDVGSVLHGTGSGLIGQVFYVFNKGILVLAAVWLAYSIFMVVLQHGLGEMQKHKIALQALRILAGFLLIIPNPNTGYSASQDLMMRVVVEGTKLADITWNYALDYLKGGGVFYTPNSTGSGISSSALTPYYHANGMVYQVLNSQICMMESTKYNKSNSKEAAYPNVQYRVKSVAPTFSNSSTQTLDAGTGVIYFPGYGNPSFEGLSPDQLTTSKTSTTLNYPNCGAISMAHTVNAITGDRAQTAQKEAFAAINQVVLDLHPLAKSIVNGTATASGGSTILANAMMDYMHLMKPVVLMAQESDSGQSDFLNEAKQQGWISAGSFYWSLMRWNDAAAKAVDPLGYQAGLYAGITFPQQLTRNISTAMNGLTTNMITGGTNGNPMGAIPTIMQTISNSNSGDIPSQPVDNDYSTGGMDFFGVLSGKLSDIVNTIQNTMQSNSYDPLTMVQNIGRACLTAAGGIWVDSLAFALVTGAIMGICTAQSPGGTVMNAAMSWVMPMWTMVSVALFAAGFMLNFYAPLYPYLLFTFGVIGWLLTVVEAMVAAPLVAFGMTHPEGHELLGRAEQALMLALSVFVRPALMIIGYLVGIILSYIAYNFINSAFGNIVYVAFVKDASSLSYFNPAQTAGQYGPVGVLGAGPAQSTGGLTPVRGIWDVVAGSANSSQGDHYTGHDLSDFLLIPLLLVLYGMLVIEVVNQSFSAIHQVPDMVLRWIGGPVGQDRSEGHVQAIKGAVSSASQQAGKLGAEGSQGMGKTLGMAVGTDIHNSQENAKAAAKQEGEEE